ncbi:hypothetical protein VB774_18885 [Pseudanabaena galeata UHCC 0370]|uniref:Uncharacterized protein n=1 Tax=Pseudanabaena galeata UHCC 0370 TaxID=3110310 RepID=A0ABU5TN54_9CYAN|nr:MULTISPECIES: hypothetical protein [Pseudanabaena]MEA5479694.1 hypothetical protein [Pseudanabaena galeata UHCC 0370]WGS72561.1 hypothetical protein OA858_00635 [Pseudanabaena galeata CCNP1313]
MQEIARTNQNPKDEWRRFAPPLIFWVLCPEQNLQCYSANFIAITNHNESQEDF